MITEWYDLYQVKDMTYMIKDINVITEKYNLYYKIISVVISEGHDQHYKVN